jgi:phosphoglycolate phosphatase
LIEFGLHRQKAEVDAAMLDLMHRDFIAYYESHICVESRLFPGVASLLDRFAAAGWGFAVCTNKLGHLSRQVLAALRVEHRFVAVCGGDTFPNRKPHPGHLIGTIAAAQGRRANAIMVGDSHVDLDTARSASVPFIGVSFGYTPVPMADLGPDILIDSFDDLDPGTAAGLLSSAVEEVSRDPPVRAALP